MGWSWRHLTHVPVRSPGDRVSVGTGPPRAAPVLSQALWLSCVKNAAYGSSGLKSLPGTWVKMTHRVQLCLHHGNMKVDQRSSLFYRRISPQFHRRHSGLCVQYRNANNAVFYDHGREQQLIFIINWSSHCSHSSNREENCVHINLMTSFVQA